jgi:hypothetical protein
MSCVAVCLPLLPTVLAPGYFAQELAADGTIKSVATCPQAFFCPGGTPSLTYSVDNLSSLSPDEPTIKRCPSNAWTTDLGATSADACSERGCFCREPSDQHVAVDL